MPEEISRYEIRELIGKGGMAEVFRAYDPHFQREVAIKMMPAEFLLDSQFRKRFEKEAMVIARLEHPAIVPVYDFGDDNGRLFLVMRLMEGGSLQDRLDGNPVALPETARLLNRLAPALDAVHSKGIVHRDLKPGNILFDEWDEPYLTDFGIVKILEDNEPALTKTGGIIGTPAYMSPEQVQGEELDGRSDIYALGVILYEMLTGAQPYHAGTAFSLALKHISEPVPRILEVNQELPSSMQVVIDHSLAKDKVDRYPTARVMAAELDALARADDQEMGALPVVGTGMVNAEADDAAEKTMVDSQQIASDTTAGGKTMLDTPAQPQPALAMDTAERPDMKSAVPLWGWIAGVILLLLLVGGLYWIFGRGGDGNQGVSQGAEGTAVPLVAAVEDSPTAAPTAAETKIPAETPTALPSDTPTPVPTLIPTTTPPAVFDAFAGTPLPDGPLAVISPANTGEIEQLSRLGKGRLYDLAYSPDGKLLALPSSSGIYLYDALTLEELLFIPTNVQLNSVAFAPGGEILAAGSADDLVRLWQVSDGTLLNTLEGHTDAVNSVAFSASGEILASGSEDDTVRLWQVSDGTLLHTLEGHTDAVNSVAFTPDGEILASGSADNSVSLWRAGDGSLLRTLEGHTDAVNSVAISADGETLASGSSDETVRLWRIADGALLNSLEEQTSRIFSVAFSPDGETLASGASGGTLLLWQTADGAVLNSLESHRAAVSSLAFAPDGETLASGTNDLVRLWKVSNGALLNTLQGNTSWVNEVAFDPDGEILASAAANRKVLLWRVTDGALLNSLEGHTSIVRSVAFSSDGETLASGAGDYTVRLWRVDEGSLLKTLEGHSSTVLAVAFTPDGEIVASGAEDSVRLWRVVDGVLLDTFELSTAAVHSLAFAPDGELLAAGTADGSVLLWRMADGALLNTFEGHTDRVTSVAFSPDGETLASGSQDSVRLWQIEDGALLDTMEGGSGAAYSLAFTPDGEILAAGGLHSLRLWRVADGALLNTLEGHTRSVHTLDFAEDGQKLASGSFDGTIRLWGVPGENN